MSSVFALDCAIKPNGFSLGNYERYWRVMLNFAVSSGPDMSLERVAEELEAYFWQDCIAVIRGWSDQNGRGNKTSMTPPRLHGSPHWT